ncbi:MAG TPA: hypothetical protein VET87_20445 [Rubrivivax sp.]|nr:hypothetical protein [Rubrivivax sp.]
MARNAGVAFAALQLTEASKDTARAEKLSEKRADCMLPAPSRFGSAPAQT